MALIVVLEDDSMVRKVVTTALTSKGTPSSTTKTCEARSCPHPS